MFLLPAFEILFGCCCVAHLYVLFALQQKEKETFCWRMNLAFGYELGTINHELL